MPTWIYSWNFHSEGANFLKDAMGIRKIKHERSNFRGGPHKRVINWGASALPEEVMRCRVVNAPDRVRVASNKLTFFQNVPADILPPWTTDFNQAVRWCAEGEVVCARTILNGHSAAGLVLMERDNPDGFVRAPLYTKYVKKEEEYRLHVVNGNVIDTQRKTLRRERAEEAANGGAPVNWKIRNLDNGFIYQREGVRPADGVVRAAVAAMRASGLDFGAVDVIWNRREERAYVLEINTAPGITGTTVQSYAEALRER